MRNASDHGRHWGHHWAIRLIMALFLITAAGSLLATPEPWQLNMTEGVTATSAEVRWLHNLIMGICAFIAVVVFGAMTVAIIKFRKSKGAKPATWHHNTTAEIIWTVIPILILIAVTIPSAQTLFKMYDVSESEMTVKVTGYQWMWGYEFINYKGETTNVKFVSRLAANSDIARQLDSGINPDSVTDAEGQNVYLLDVDKPLVLPTNTKIRFVITSDDVIHSWWVPVLGWKQDAIPNIINEAWTEILKPGTYRGQCAELCGKDHGFMPIVVKAVPPAAFEQWLAAQAPSEEQTKQAAAIAAVKP